jgi:hypothetical protein
VRWPHAYTAESSDCVCVVPNPHWVSIQTPGPRFPSHTKRGDSRGIGVLCRVPTHQICAAKRVEGFTGSLVTISSGDGGYFTEGTTNNDSTKVCWVYWRWGRVLEYVTVVYTNRFGLLNQIQRMSCKYLFATRSIRRTRHSLVFSLVDCESLGGGLERRRPILCTRKVVDGQTEVPHPYLLFSGFPPKVCNSKGRHPLIRPTHTPQYL